jgi:hypothetical protein
MHHVGFIYKTLVVWPLKKAALRSSETSGTDYPRTQCRVRVERNPFTDPSRWVSTKRTTTAAFLSSATVLDSKCHELRAAPQSARHTKHHFSITNTNQLTLHTQAKCSTLCGKTSNQMAHAVTGSLEMVRLNCQ